MKKISVLFLLLFILVSCTSISTPSPIAETEQPVPASWWREAVFYEIFVRSFCDSDGNGIGDFNGITSKLDYLQDLGITGIWLMPINPSPSYHGYDVVNYYAVNLDYGTMADFKNLVKEAHARGIRIIIDLVLNHTSSQHPFFEAANSDPQSEYRDWYIWSDTYPGNYWYSGTTQYYYSYFSYAMPDLNYKNPEVTDQMYNVVRFWLDGFRIDAAKHLIEEGLRLEGTESTHAWLRNFYTMYKTENPEAYTVGEIYGAGAFAATVYTGDQLDQIFNFEMSAGFMNSALGESNTGIYSAITFALEDMPGGEYATFLTNHDQNRSMSTLRGDLGKAKVAAALMLTSPGTPFLYYGEEIGMQGKKPDEDIRRPMQWDATPNAGFTSGIPWRDPASDFVTVNAAIEANDPDSLLNYYRSLIKLRTDHSALRTGEMIPLATGNTGIYAVIREDESESLLVLVNLKSDPITDYALALSTTTLPDATYNPVTLFGSGIAAEFSITNGQFSNYQPLAELAGHTAYVFKIK
jgi:alpha-amylase